MSAAEQSARERQFRDDLVAILPSLRSFARGLCGNREMADDLVQDTMNRAWRARDRYVDDSNFRAWIFKILRNQFYTTIRKGKRFVDCEEGLAERALTENGGQEQAVFVSEVAEALQRLTPDHREVLMLVGANGLEYAEAAVILGCATGTVKSRMCRARAALARELYGEDESDFGGMLAERSGMWERSDAHSAMMTG